MTPLPLRLFNNTHETRVSNESRACKGFSFTSTRCKGFSFIEMLIAISVMAIIFSFGFANYRDFSKRKQVEAAASQVKGDLAFTKEYALSGVKPVNAACNSPQVLSLYRFRIVDNNTYVIEALCTGSATAVSAKNPQPPDLPYGVTMTSEILTNCSTSSGSGSFIEFLPRGNGTSLRSVDCFRIRFSQSGFTQDIIIDSSGSIR